ncbi:MAG: hypothetical protein ACTSVV_17130 [Promethearchaeota archaeon]
MNYKFPGSGDKILFSLFLNKSVPSKTLMEQSQLNKSKYQETLNDLLDKGLINFDTPSNDRRVKLYFLTETGEELIKKEYKFRRRMNFKLFLTYVMGIFYIKHPELKDDQKLNDFILTFPKSVIKEFEDKILEVAGEFFGLINRNNNRQIISHSTFRECLHLSYTKIDKNTGRCDDCGTVFCVYD